MNIALLFQHKLVTSLQRLLGDFSQPKAAPASAQRPVLAMAPAKRPPSVQRTKSFDRHATRVSQPRVIPLRVVRVVEQGQSAASSGRLVISGRMADVCAELDRLAAREAAMQ